MKAWSKDLIMKEAILKHILKETDSQYHKDSSTYLTLCWSLLEPRYKRLAKDFKSEFNFVEQLYMLLKQGWQCSYEGTEVNFENFTIFHEELGTIVASKNFGRNLTVKITYQQYFSNGDKNYAAKEDEAGISCIEIPYISQTFKLIFRSDALAQIAASVIDDFITDIYKDLSYLQEHYNQYKLAEHLEKQKILESIKEAISQQVPELLPEYQIEIDINGDYYIKCSQKSEIYYWEQDYFIIKLDLANLTSSIQKVIETIYYFNEVQKNYKALRNNCAESKICF